MRVLTVLGWLAAAHVAQRALQAWGDGNRARRVPSGGGQNEEGSRDPAPGVSVIVPAWNDRDALDHTFPALARALGHYPGEVQLLVVAGGADGSLSRARALVQGLAAPNVGAEVLDQTPRGKNAALNQGLRAARHDVLVFLDADTAPEPDWLPALVGPIARGEADATTGLFQPFRQTSVSGIFEVDQLASQVIARRVTMFGGGSIALGRAALERLGGELPEDVPVGVDWDLSQRLERAGAVLAFREAARVQTEIAETWPEYRRGEVRWRRAYLHAQARHLRQDRHPTRLLGLVYLPLLQGALLLGWAAFPVAARLSGGRARTGLWTWGLLTGWVLGRHASTCLGVYAYTRDLRWLRLTPAYLAGFLVSAAAAWRAILSPRQMSAQFKGQRPRRSTP